MNIGDKVYKAKGYKFPGVIVSKFTTIAGKERFVVECTSPDCSGCLHIFNEIQLTTDAGLPLAEESEV